MALIVQTVAGIAGANSYSTVADANGYFAARGTASAIAEENLVLAMDYLEGLPFCGTPALPDNELSLPRIASDLTAAQSLAAGKKSQILIAYYISIDSLGVDKTKQMSSSGGALIEKSMDIMTERYSAPTVASVDIEFYKEFPLLEKALAPLFCKGSSNGAGARRLLRA